MFTKLFWKDTLERAISTAAQFALGVIGLSENGFGIITQNVTWELIGFSALSGFILAILKALAAYGLTKGNSASLLNGYSGAFSYEDVGAAFPEVPDNIILGEE